MKQKRNTLCGQCGALIVAAWRAGQVNASHIRNHWSCDDCGYEFETDVYLAPRTAGRDPGVEYQCVAAWINAPSMA